MVGFPLTPPESRSPEHPGADAGCCPRAPDASTGLSTEVDGRRAIVDNSAACPPRGRPGAGLRAGRASDGPAQRPSDDVHDLIDVAIGIPIRRGRPDAALRITDEVLSKACERGAALTVATISAFRANITGSQGDLATATSVYLEALEYDEQVGNRTGMGIVLDNLATKASAEGRHLAAVRLAGASDAIKKAAGGHAPPPFIDLPDPRDAAREVLSDAAVDAAWEEGQAMTLEQALAYARSSDG